MKWITCLLLGLCIIGAATTFAQDAAPAISPTLAAQMDRLEAYTEASRGLSLSEPIERAFPTRADVRAYLARVYERELPPQEAERVTALYVALGMLPADADLGALYLELMGSQVAGFYDSETRTMNVVPTGDRVRDTLSLTDQITYVHEYVHALQDAAFGLDAMLSDPALNDAPDRSLAVLALIEGDATAIMNLYNQQVTANNPFAALQLLGEGLRAGNLLLPPNIPPALTRELLFPYDYGFAFVLALYNAGGWDAINAAFSDPPTSTEQILHPEKYLAGELPLPVELGAVAAALGEGWSLQWDITLGEYYLTELLRAHLDRARAVEAAAGWGGDQFQVFSRADGSLAWALRIRFDTPLDAGEFARALIQYGNTRFGGQERSDCWAAEAEALCHRAEDGVFTVTYAPSLEKAQAMRAQP